MNESVLTGQKGCKEHETGENLHVQVNGCSDRLPLETQSDYFSAVLGNVLANDVSFLRFCC